MHRRARAMVLASAVCRESVRPPLFLYFFAIDTGTRRALRYGMARTATQKNAQDDSRSPLAGLGRLTGNGTLPPGETALMRAVLEDAILCFLGLAKRRRIAPQILAREAEYWIRSQDLESPFSFDNVCHVLGLCAESTRREILGWKDQGIPAAVVEADDDLRVLH